MRPLPASWLTLLLAMAMGCGGSYPRARSTTGPSTAVGDRRLVVVERPLGGHVALSLWIDAGTLDGGSAALVAAELLAARTSTDPLVTPDGTRFHALCDVGELEACLARLGEIVGAREPSEDELDRARERVARARQIGLGSTRREAEVLAVGAALSLDLEPLGSPSLEASARSVSEFLADHFGDERSLWVVIGDVHERDVVRAIERLPRRSARRERAERVASEAIARAQASEHAGAGRWAIARRASSEDEARAIAQAWRRRAWMSAAHTYAFPSRAGWVALSSFDDDDGQSDDVRLRFAFARPWPARSAPPSEDAWAYADRVGARWVAGEPAPREPRIGIAFVGPRAQERVQALGLEPPPSPWRDATIVELPDRAGLTVAWALEGPETEGASSHGASALAASVLARRCAPDARVSVTPDAVVVTLEGDRAEDVLARAAAWSDCVASTTPSLEEIEAARGALLAQASLDDERRTLAAEALVETAPGLVAPLPGRSALARVPAEDGVTRFSRWRAGGRWAFVGDRDALELVRDRTTTPGEAPAPRAPELEVGASGTSVRADVESAERLLVVGLSGCGDATLGRAWLARLASIARDRGASVTWSASGAARALTWAAITARAAPGAFDGFDALPPPEPRASGPDPRAVVALMSPAAIAARSAVGAPLARCQASPVVRTREIEPFPARR